MQLTKLHEGQQGEVLSFVHEVEQAALCIHLGWGPPCWSGLRVVMDSIIGGFHGFTRQNHADLILYW